jgi:hypothetical protein
MHDGLVRHHCWASKQPANQAMAMVVGGAVAATLNPASTNQFKIKFFRYGKNYSFF